MTPVDLLMRLRGREVGVAWEGRFSCIFEGLWLPVAIGCRLRGVEMDVPVADTTDWIATL